MAVYLLVNADAGTVSTFRVLVLMIVVSTIYDILWFSFRNSNTANRDDPEMQSLEITIIAFSFWMAWISFFFKIIMIFVFWRTSLDFAAVIDHRSQLLK